MDYTWGLETPRLSEEYIVEFNNILKSTLAINKFDKLKVKFLFIHTQKIISFNDLVRRCLFHKGSKYVK